MTMVLPRRASRPNSVARRRMVAAGTPLPRGNLRGVLLHVLLQQGKPRLAEHSAYLVDPLQGVVHDGSVVVDLGPALPSVPYQGLFGRLVAHVEAIGADEIGAVGLVLEVGCILYSQL